MIEYYFIGSIKKDREFLFLTVIMQCVCSIKVILIWVPDMDHLIHNFHCSVSNARGISNVLCIEYQI